MTFFVLTLAFLVLLIWLLLQRRPAKPPGLQDDWTQRADAATSSVAPALFVISQVAGRHAPPRTSARAIAAPAAMVAVMAGLRPSSLGERLGTACWIALVGAGRACGRGAGKDGDHSMRPVLGVLLLSVLLSVAASAEPYRDQPAIRTAAFCTGVMSQAGEVLSLLMAKTKAQDEVEKLVAPYERDAADLAGFTAAHQVGAGMTTEDGLVFVSRGQEAVTKLANKPNAQSVEQFLLMTNLCSLLANAVAAENAKSIGPAFNMALQEFAPYVTD